ncbi:DUF3147 family protein [Kolteria novifilia]
MRDGEDVYCFVYPVAMWGRIREIRTNKGTLHRMYYVIKVLLTAGLVVAVSEASKRSSLLGGLLASLPLVSFFGMIWLYTETGNTQKVADLSRSVFWLVLPSLPFFLLLPVLLRKGWGFYGSLIVSTILMVGLYSVMVLALRRAGVEL